MYIIHWKHMCVCACVSVCVSVRIFMYKSSMPHTSSFESCLNFNNLVLLVSRLFSSNHSWKNVHSNFIHLFLLTLLHLSQSSIWISFFFFFLVVLYLPNLAEQTRASVLCVFVSKNRYIHGKIPLRRNYYVTGDDDDDDEREVGEVKEARHSYFYISLDVICLFRLQPNTITLVIWQHRASHIPCCCTTCPTIDLELPILVPFLFIGHILQQYSLHKFLRKDRKSVFKKKKKRFAVLHWHFFSRIFHGTRFMEELLATDLYIIN